jgi:hypothetical protein
MRINLASILLLVLAAVSASAQSPDPDPSPSLGDYARALRQNKKPSTVKQFDNDNLPRDPTLSVVGEPSAEDPNQAAAPPSGASDSAPKAGEPDKRGAFKSAESPADQQARYNDWKQRIEAQKTAIDATAHELDLLQREYRLRAAAFYGDAGNRLRNSAQWDQQNTQYQQQIADKEKAVDDAKQKLDDLQEDARKAGVPSAMRE